MKKVLIIGENSYIGTSLVKWLKHWENEYAADKISVRDGGWKGTDFSGYDVVVHAAGIAHIKETKKNAALYYAVNRDLTYAVACKAKIDGVKQFIFLSSMSVYGMDLGVITRQTTPCPKSCYGKSKYEAEKLLQGLDDENFRIAIVRPPMVYGKGCKGNFLKLLDFNLPVFPKIKNERSMIYIDNLCEFLRLLIDNEDFGIFFPQNLQYVCTSTMVSLIAEKKGKKVLLTGLFNGFIDLFKFGIFNKVFGSLVYEKEMSAYRKNYCIFDFEQSIEYCCKDF
ncbi:MAG: NAD-dependent epimerase/dehydratase family protein [Clostridia bacterium]|nr:NAD-dependent epimerase/dehydratase family protein [Clostridia bacterium]